MPSIIQIADSKENKAKVRGWLENGKLAEALDAQEEIGGWVQVATLLSADSILSSDLNWPWHEANYPLDMALQEWTENVRRYGKNTYPLTEKQKEWAGRYLQEQFNRATS